MTDLAQTDPRDRAYIYDQMYEVEEPEDGVETRPRIVLALRLATYLANLRFLDALARQTALRVCAQACVDASENQEPAHLVLRDWRYLAVTRERGGYDLKTGRKVAKIPHGLATLAIDLNQLYTLPQDEQDA